MDPKVRQGSAGAASTWSEWQGHSSTGAGRTEQQWPSTTDIRKSSGASPCGKVASLAAERELRAKVTKQWQSDQLVESKGASMGTPGEPTGLVPRRTQDPSRLEEHVGVLRQSDAHSSPKISRMLHRMDSDGKERLEPAEFGRTIKDLKPDMTARDMSTLLTHFDKNGDGVIDYGEFLQAIRGLMPANRRALVEECFAKLDRDGSKALSEAELIEHFDARSHTDVQRGVREPLDVVRSFITNFRTSAGESCVSKEGFISYYTAVNTAVKNDAFAALVNGTSKASQPATASQGCTCRTPADKLPDTLKAPGSQGPNVRPSSAPGGRRAAGSRAFLGRGEHVDTGSRLGFGESQRSPGCRPE